MQQAIDTFFEFDKGTVVGQVANSTFDQRTFWVTIGNIFPRILLGLLHTQRNLLFFPIYTEHDHFDFITDLDEFIGVADPLGPGHLTDVDESFDAFF